MPASKLYHRDVYAPEAIFRSPGVMRLDYTRHARQAAADDKYGDLTRHFRHYLDFDCAEIVEVEVTAGAISKRVIRHNISPELALVMVVTADGRVKTVWGNLLSDNHATLDRRKFVQPVRVQNSTASRRTVH